MMKQHGGSAEQRGREGGIQGSGAVVGRRAWGIDGVVGCGWIIGAAGMGDRAFSQHRCEGGSMVGQRWTPGQQHWLGDADRVVDYGWRLCLRVSCHKGRIRVIAFGVRNNESR